MGRDQVLPGFRQRDPFDPPVVLVLLALHETFLDQPLDRASGGGYGEPQFIGELVDGQGVLRLGEDQQRPELGERQIGLDQRLQSGVLCGAVDLAEEGLQRIEHRGGMWSGHAEDSSKDATIARTRMTSVMSHSRVPHTETGSASRSREALP